MKPEIEKITPTQGQSFLIKQFEDQYANQRPRWHAHPEYEIVYISNGRGKRHIGNNISTYNNGDLIMLGPNLPHLGFSLDEEVSYTEVLIQMKEDFLGETFFDLPEMYSIKRLFERSRSGISFHGKTKERVGRFLMSLVNGSPFQKLSGLLQVLQGLAESEEFTTLNANAYTYSVMLEDEERLNVIYQYVEEYFHEPIALKDIAAQINMSVPAFCRFFKKVTQHTFVQFLNDYRITHACKLLKSDSSLIAEIALESGFNNISHFNKQFLKVTGQTPREYKHSYKPVIHLSQNP